MVPAKVCCWLIPAKLHHGRDLSTARTSLQGSLNSLSVMYKAWYGLGALIPEEGGGGWICGRSLQQNGGFEVGSAMRR